MTWIYHILVNQNILELSVPVAPALKIDPNSCVFGSNAVCRFILSIGGVNTASASANELFDIEEFQLIPAIVSAGIN